MSENSICARNVARLGRAAWLSKQSAFGPLSNEIMKITRINRNGERREALLKEYFLTASLLALFQRLSAEAAKAMPQQAPAKVPVRVRR
jgi:hypothetical protein